MSVEQMPDERLAHFYENIRQQVEADRAYKHQFMANPTVRQCADKLRGEIIKRRLRHAPIDWPSFLATMRLSGKRTIKDRFSGGLAVSVLTPVFSGGAVFCRFIDGVFRKVDRGRPAERTPDFGACLIQPDGPFPPCRVHRLNNAIFKSLVFHSQINLLTLARHRRRQTFWF
jgi:hypothetical protein